MPWSVVNDAQRHWLNCVDVLLDGADRAELAETAVAGVTSNAAKAIVRKIAGETAEAAGKKTASYIGSRAVAATTAETAEIAARRAGAMATRQFGQFVTATPRFADDFARATANTTARNERRLMMMAPARAESGQAGTVVARLASGNANEMIETLWKHRDKVGAVAAVTGLLLHGEDIVEAGAEFVAKPVIDGAMDNVVAPISRLFVSALHLTFVIGLAGLAAFLFGARRRNE